MIFFITFFIYPNHKSEQPTDYRIFKLKKYLPNGSHSKEAFKCTSGGSMSHCQDSRKLFVYVIQNFTIPFLTPGIFSMILLIELLCPWSLSSNFVSIV